MLRIPHRWFSLGFVLRRVALAYMVAWVLSPYLAYGLGWRIVLFACMALWGLLELRAPRSVLLRPNAIILMVWGYLLYTLAVELIFTEPPDLNRHIQLGIMFFFLLVGESARRRDDGELQFVFWAVLLILPTAIIGTLYGIENTAADVARTVVRSSDEARKLSEMGIGGYATVYAVVLVLPFLTQMAWFAKRLHLVGSGPRALHFAKRLLIIGNWLLCVYLVIRAGYSIALILATVSTALALVVRSRRVVKLGMGTAFAATIAFVLVISAAPLVDVLLDWTAGTEYYTKVVDIRDSFSENKDEGTLAGRSDRYALSAQLAIENPFIGTLYFLDTGKHSSILDRFAQYGLLLGGAFMFLMTFMAWRVLRDTRVPIGLGLAFAVVSVVFPFVNTIFSAWGLVLYVFSLGAFEVMGITLGRKDEPASDTWRPVGNETHAVGSFGKTS